MFSIIKLSRYAWAVISYHADTAQIVAIRYSTILYVMRKGGI